MFTLAHWARSHHHARMLPAQPDQAEAPRFIVGAMTGTSIDGGLDAAIVSVHGRGLAMHAPLILGRTYDLGALSADLRRIAAQEALTARELARIAHEFGVCHADAISSLCGEAGVTPDLVVLHGQTVFHAPPHSWQLIDPWPVATRLGCAVRYDLRGANLASGGQGAPITPIADFVLFADTVEPKTILNLGGFANGTLLPPRERGVDGVRGFDICPCNHLLDRVAHTRLGRPYDEDGHMAARGKADTDLAARIASVILPPAAPVTTNRGARSLGTGDEAARAVELTVDLAPEDACATVAEALAIAIARSIAEAGHAQVSTIVVAGGSARHRFLRNRLAAHTGSVVETSDEHAGIPVQMREAAAMAVLGALADDRMSFALPRVTGAPSAVVDSARISPLPAENVGGLQPL